MYIYKLHETDVLNVQGEFKHIATEGQWLYVESEKKLKAPFIITELPGAMRKEEEARLKELKEAKIRTLKEAREAKKEDFSSSALGEANLYPHYNEHGLPRLVAEIVTMDKMHLLCKKEGEDWKGVLHTKEQASEVVRDFLKIQDMLDERLNDVLTAVKDAKNREEIEAISF